jgi:hypothetical protein
MPPKPCRYKMLLKTASKLCLAFQAAGCSASVHLHKCYKNKLGEGPGVHCAGGLRETTTEVRTIHADEGGGVGIV